MNRKMFMLVGLSLCITPLAIASSLVEYGKAVQEGVTHEVRSLLDNHPFVCGAVMGAAVTGTGVFVYQRMGTTSLPKTLTKDGEPQVALRDLQEGADDDALVPVFTVPPAPELPDLSKVRLQPSQGSDATGLQPGVAPRSRSVSPRPQSGTGEGFDQEVVAKKETLKAICMVVRALEGAIENKRARNSFSIDYQAGKDGGAGYMVLKANGVQDGSVRMTYLEIEKARVLERLLAGYVEFDIDAMNGLKEWVGMDAEEELTVAALVKLDPSLKLRK